MKLSTILLLVLSFNIAVACTTKEAQAIKKVEKEGTYPVAEYTKENNLEAYATAVFAGGCFWCTEAAFQRIKGVVDVISGYSGGDEANPEYGQVGAGETGHAEAIYIFYDSSIIDYETLLEVFFVAHDPTTLNYQGPDYGEEYRSAIFYKTDEEKVLIDKVIKRTNEAQLYPNPIVTQVEPYKEFWVAEAYHQNYYELHPDHGYVARVSRPKVLKVKKQFPYLIKDEYK